MKQSYKTKTLLLLGLLLAQITLKAQKILLDKQLEVIPTPALKLNKSFFSPVPVIKVGEDLSVKLRNNPSPFIKVPNAVKGKGLGICSMYFKRAQSEQDETAVLIVNFRSESPEFYIDHNQNFDFTDDGQPIKMTDSQYVELSVKNPRDKNATYTYRLKRPEPKALSESFVQQIANSTTFRAVDLSAPEYWYGEINMAIRSADVSIGGTKFQIGLYDRNKNGLYNDPKDRLLISEFGNDRLSVDLNDNNYQINDGLIFGVGNKGFETISIDPSGKSVTINPIDFGNIPPKTKVGELLSDQIKVKSLSGRVVNLSDLLVKGKYNYIEFWGTWCAGCIQEIPKLIEVNEKYSDQLNIIGLHYGSLTSAKLQAFLDKKQIKWQQYIASKENIKEFNVDGFPYGILINPELKFEAFSLGIEGAIDNMRKK